MIIRFKPFVKANFKVSDEYIDEIEEKAKYEDDEKAQEELADWLEAYDDASREGDY